MAQEKPTDRRGQQKEMMQRIIINRFTQEGKRNDGSSQRRAEGHTLLHDAAEINDAHVESEGG